MFGTFMIQKQDDPIKKVYDECINALSGQKLQNQQKCPKEYTSIMIYYVLSSLRSEGIVFSHL